MKKKVLYLLIISAILMLVGWTQIGKALATQESKAVVSEPNLRAQVPDYFEDGKFFNDTYLKNAPSKTRLEALDYRLDAEIFNDWYRDVSALQPKIAIPDYPADGKFFNDMYLRNVPSGTRREVEALDYPADAKIFYDMYLNKSLSSENLDFPDYPLDGKFFVEQYAEQP